MSTLNVPPDNEPVSFSEDLNTQEFSFSGNTFAMRRSFLTDWNKRFLLSKGFMGGARIWGKGSLSPFLTRYLPFGFPHLVDPRPVGGKSFLYPVGVERIQGRGPTRKLTGNPLQPDTNRINDPNLYAKALVTFLFEAPTYAVLEDAQCPTVTFRSKNPPVTSTLLTVLGNSYISRFEARRWVTRITQPSTEVLRLPIGYFQYVEGFFRDGKSEALPKIRVDVGTHVINPTMEVTYVWHMVPALVQPWEDGTDWMYVDQGANQPGVKAEMVGAVYTHLGCVNARWFDGFPPGTLLLTAVEARPYRWITGERFYDYTFRMKFFNPHESFKEGSFPYVGPPTSPINSRDPTVPHSFAGHNYYLRLKQPSKEGDQTIVARPYYSLITDGGQTLEDGGRPVFQYRDFEDLFVPYNRAHMVRYYKTATLTPLWNGDVGT